MRKIREGKTLGTQMVDGKELPIIQPEIYERIYCKNCDNEVDSEEQAIGTCSECNQPWSANKAIDIKVNILEMPPIGAESGE